MQVKMKQTRVGVVKHFLRRFIAQIISANARSHLQDLRLSGRANSNHAAKFRVAIGHVPIGKIEHLLAQTCGVEHLHGDHHGRQITPRKFVAHLIQIFRMVPAVALKTGADNA